jgi:RNA polymerase sigma-70 factor (ECF subfamily)
MPLTDDDIIAQVRAGAKPRFALLIERHQDQAMTLACRMLKRREEAEEAVQDAFIRAYNALEKFEGSARFGTWLYRIVYNVCLTRLERAGGAPAGVAYDDELGYGDEMCVAPVDQVESEDLLRFIRKSIESLPAKYATVLSLFYLQDLTHEEICKVTDLPLGTVKTHLFRARALLQRELIKELQPETMTP